MRYLVTVSYKGTRYKGWAKQVDALTIQGVIEEKLSQYFNLTIAIYGSGRTDAGVHALGQTFHFDVENKIPDLSLFKYSLNCMLPNDIHFIKVQAVDDLFHARFSAKSKTYIYSIYRGENNPFVNDFYTVIPASFSYFRFLVCLTYFYGKHNFRNFTSKEEDEQKFVRKITRLKVSRFGKRIYILFKGDGFMRYQIRYIVGTALACALGKISLKEVKLLIKDDSTERKIVSYKAEPEGLTLKKVTY